MTDQPQPAIGTVAEEAVRLMAAMAAMATMARSGAVPSNDATDVPGPYAAGPAQEPQPGDPRYAGEQAQEPVPPDTEQAPRECGACGGERDGTPVACRLCPLCQGIALLRSVRPETVDRLADLASAVAAGLRDMAGQSRAASPASEAGSGSGMPSHGANVQDIRVDDEDDE